MLQLDTHVINSVDRGEVDNQTQCSTIIVTIIHM